MVAAFIAGALLFAPDKLVVPLVGALVLFLPILVIATWATNRAERDKREARHPSRQHSDGP